MPSLPVVVVEDDPFTRLIGIVLDPATSRERVEAFADFMSPDAPDFAGWIARVRERSAGLHPATVHLVETEDQMRAALAAADALVVESFRVGDAELAGAPKLKVVQKFGALVRNIDTIACARRGVKVRTLRRRANISCAEHVFALMLALARRLEAVTHCLTVAQMERAGLPLRRFQRQHTPGGNYARIPGTRSLNEATVGILGMGEIGQEIAIRAAAFGMRVLYYQRTPLSPQEAHGLQVEYSSLDALLERSDWIVPQLPASAQTAGIIGREAFARMKPGACLVNVANAPLVDRASLLDALMSGRLAGAAFDIHPEEPVADDDPLLGFDNVILTPHMAGSPRWNGLDDFEQLISGLAREFKP